MSGKSLKSLNDENQDLQKQICCITGFFKLFQNSTSSGGQNNETKQLNYMINETKTENQNITRVKQQFSTESSITPISSSPCSSSKSSLDFNRKIKIESSSTRQIQDPKNPHSEVSIKSQQSLDFYDIIKDSMHREAKGLYVKTLDKQEKITLGVMDTLSMSKKPHWDSPRLSYNALKPTTKYKELPRLSLDSKQGSIQGINEGNNARTVSNDPRKEFERNSNTMPNQIQELETLKRSSGVVTKLMGLEALPDSTQTRQISSCSSTEKTQIMARTSTNNEYKKHQSPASPRKCQGFALPQSRRDDESRFVLESTTPTNANQNSLLQDSSKGSDSDIKASKSCLSVYGEIEKRRAELEFKKSGKDLRALKQVLEAMQRFSDSTPDNSKVQSPRMQQNESPLKSFEVETPNFIQDTTFPIVIMKSTKVTTKASKCSATNEIIVDKPKTKYIGSPTKLMQSSKSSQESNITVTGSPRLPKKFGFERRSSSTSPSSDSTASRKQNHRQQNFSILQDRDANFSEMNSHWRKFKHNVNVISSDFDRNRSLDTLSDIQVVRIDRLVHMNKNNTIEEIRKENSKGDKSVTSEQPSPVSVLDAEFYEEDPPSPLKKMSNISKDLCDALNNDDESEENSADQILQEIVRIDEKLVNFNNIKNSDHSYISEILIASGLVSDQNSNQILHSPGHKINPKLFFALEQTKKNKSLHINIEHNAVKNQISCWILNG